MTILNFGSCCIDHVYSVPHFAAPGETLPCSAYEVHPGGKGLNQSIALAAAGARVSHAGSVGEDGRWLIDLMSEKKIDTRFMRVDSGPSGHAIIQVTPAGENSIVLFGGANRTITTDNIDQVLAGFGTGDFLLVQNEISSTAYLMQAAKQKEMRIAFNAAPMTPEVSELPLGSIELLVINEIEGFELTGQTEADAITSNLLSRFPAINVLLTLGAAGSLFVGQGISEFEPAQQVDATDTTAAGDTFTGFFLAAYSEGKSVRECLGLATRAAAICVTRSGAATSIPDLEELLAAG